jgi:soluble lytic murein transglycosylase-like protein
MNAPKQQLSLFARFAEGVRAFVGDVVGGCLVITHNSLALLGVAVVAAAVLIASQSGLRHQAETRLAVWLSRQQPEQEVAQAPVVVEQTAVDRATAADPQALPREQAKLALWIARKYQVAPEPVAALVSGAYKAGQASHIDPSLILAVMAIESGFNPFAQSTAGAQGLMQVMTRVHVDKYDGYGGQFAAFDPLSNLRVGVWVLRDCIDKAGSTEGGLRCYVGAAHLKTDRGYASKVLAEYGRLQQIVAQAHQRSRHQPANMTATAPQPDQTARISKPKADVLVVASAKTGE